MQSHQELVRRHLASVVLPREDKFTATHYAYLNNGLFVYVPRDVDVTIPLDLTYPLASNERMSCVHTLIVVERGARVQIVEQIQDCSSAPGPIIHVAEVVAAPGSNIHYTTIQNTPVGSRYFAMRRAILDRDARMEWVLAAFGGGLSKDSTETILRGDGCEANSLLMFFGNGEQHFDIGVAMEHEGLHTTSDILGRGVCDNHARGIYRANTHISKGAHFTSAYQRQNTLLLTKEARADAIPALTIDDDEVQAGHAATVGQIDTDQLFYLMSRGLPASDAIRMVALGFVDPVLQRVPSPEKRDLLQQLIDRKMTL
jgi:Fe-S cluster assembly protein SufD